MTILPKQWLREHFRMWNEHLIINWQYGTEKDDQDDQLRKGTYLKENEWLWKWNHFSFLTLHVFNLVTILKQSLHFLIFFISESNKGSICTLLSCVKEFTGPVLELVDMVKLAPGRKADSHRTADNATGIPIKVHISVGQNVAPVESCLFCWYSEITRDSSYL